MRDRRADVCVLLIFAYRYPSPTRRAYRVVGENRRTIISEGLGGP